MSSSSHKIFSLLTHCTSSAASVFLWGLLLILLVLGTLLPQHLTPEQYRLLAPELADALLFLGADDLFRSHLFMIVLGALALELTMQALLTFCQMPSQHTLDTYASPKPAIASESSTTLSPNAAGPPTSTNSAKTLKSNAFEPTQSADSAKTLNSNAFEPTQEPHAFTPKRRAWARICRCLGVALALTALIVSRYGSVQGRLVLSPGHSALVPGVQPPLSVTLEDFSVQRHPDGSPSAYLAHLTVSNQQNKAFTGAMQVNSPLHYKGWSFYPAACSLKSWQIIYRQNSNRQDSSRHSVLLSPVSGNNLPVFTFPETPERRFMVHRFWVDAWPDGAEFRKRSNVPGQIAALIVEWPKGAISPAEAHTLGWLSAATPLKLGQGAELSLGDVNLQCAINYKRDRGYALALAGFALIFIGVLL